MGSSLKMLLGREIPEQLLFIEDLPSADWSLEREGSLGSSPDDDHVFIRFVKRDEDTKPAIYGECQVHAESVTCNPLPIEDWVESVEGDAQRLNWDDSSSKHYDSLPARIWREVKGL